MADSGIKKYRQQYSNLPPISAETQGYSVRYRILSEDKNRTSHWSPIYVLVPNYTYVSGTKEFSHNSNISNFTWDPVTVLKSNLSSNDITNKSLTDNIATLTTSDAHYMNVGDWVTVEGVDVVFNGTYKISAVNEAGNQLSYYRDNANILSTAVTPAGTRKTNTVVGIATTYDVWLRWGHGDNTGDWIYKERVSTTSISYPTPDFFTINGAVQPQAINRLSIEIYLVGFPIQDAEGNPAAPFLEVYNIQNQTI
jgi:hypothetical protein